MTNLEFLAKHNINFADALAYMKDSGSENFDEFLKAEHVNMFKQRDIVMLKPNADRANELDTGIRIVVGSNEDSYNFRRISVTREVSDILHNKVQILERDWIKIGTLTESKFQNITSDNPSLL